MATASSELVRIQCPHCGMEYNISEGVFANMIGRSVVCKRGCRELFTISPEPVSVDPIIPAPRRAVPPLRPASVPGAKKSLRFNLTQRLIILAITALTILILLISGLFSAGNIDRADMVGQYVSEDNPDDILTLSENGRFVLSAKGLLWIFDGKIKGEWRLVEGNKLVMLYPAFGSQQKYSWKAKRNRVIEDDGTVWKKIIR